MSPPYDQNVLFNALAESVQREQLQKGQFQDLVVGINGRQATESAKPKFNNSILTGKKRSDKNSNRQLKEAASQN